MSATTAASLYDFVANVSELRIYPIILETVLYTLFTAIIASALKLQLGRGFCDARARYVLIGTCLTMYLMSTLAWALDLRLLWRDLFHLLPSPLPAVAASAVPGALQHFDARFLLAHTVFSFVNLFLCDVVVLWRAYVLYERPRWLLLTSLTLGFLALIVYIISVVIVALTFVPNAALPVTAFLTAKAAGNFELNGLLLANLLSIGVTILANVFALGLVVNKVVIHRRAIQGLLVKRPHTQIQTVDVLTMIAESNLAYTCFLIFYIIMYAGLFGRTAYYYAFFLIAPVSGIYPSLLVALVALQRTVLERGFARSSVASSSVASSAAPPAHYAELAFLRPGSPRSPASTYAGSLGGSTVLGASPAPKSPLALPPFGAPEREKAAF